MCLQIIRELLYHDNVVDIMYRLARLLSTLPVRMDMEQLLNYYLNNMLMSASVRRYETRYYTVLLLWYYSVVANIHVV